MAKQLVMISEVLGIPCRRAERGNICSLSMKPAMAAASSLMGAARRRRNAAKKSRMINIS